MRKGVVIALASTLVGCWSGAMNKGVGQDEALLGQLSMQQKQPLYAAQHDVSVARANLAAADRAKDDADVFKRAAAAELNIADARIPVAQNALRIAQHNGEPSAIADSQRELDAAKVEAEAARAQVDYADRLATLRIAERDLARRELTASIADYDLARVQVLDRNGLRPAEDVGQLIRARSDAHAGLSAAMNDVETHRHEVAQSEARWRTARRQFNVAERPTGTIPTPREPPQREPVPIPGVGKPFGTGTRPGTTEDQLRNNAPTPSSQDQYSPPERQP